MSTVMTITEGQRLRDFYLPESALFALLARNQEQWLQVKLLNLPEGARLLAVTYSWERRAFLARFEHESFPPVPGGWVVEIGGELEMLVKREESPDVPVCMVAPHG